MATLVLLGLFLFSILYAWSRKKTSFPDLARTYLWITPFVPLVSLINHNIDHDRFGPFFRFLPFYFMTGLLLTSLHLSVEVGYRWRFTKEFLFLGLYALLSLLGIFWAADPVWGLITWSWAIPGCVLFLIAGHSTSPQDIATSRVWAYTVLGFLGVNLALVAYGMLTGRATDLFFTRNFGSCFASNAVLIFLTLYSGFAWLRVRSSFVLMFLFFCFSALSILISISRTSVAVVLVYVSFLATLPLRQAHRLVVSLLIAGACLCLVVQSFSRVSGFNLSEQLIMNWGARLGGESLGANFEHAMSHRSHIFQAEWRHVREANPFIGVGFGNFHATSHGGFRDGHNLLLTEVYENGLFATVFLYALFSCGVLATAGKVLQFSRDEWPMGFCLWAFLFVSHTTGAVLSSRGSDSYFTPVYGWALCFLIGFLTRARVHKRTAFHHPLAVRRRRAAPST